MGRGGGGRLNLEEIWKKIPPMECEEGCNECCLWPSRTPLEEERVRRWLGERGREERVGKVGGKCPYAEDGRCSIWPVRFLPCRLFGVVETVRCPKGRGPSRFLTEEEAVVLIMELDEENGRFMEYKRV